MLSAAKIASFANRPKEVTLNNGFHKDGIYGHGPLMKSMAMNLWYLFLKPLCAGTRKELVKYWEWSLRQKSSGLFTNELSIGSLRKVALDVFRCEGSRYAFLCHFSWLPALKRCIYTVVRNQYKRTHFIWNRYFSSQRYVDTVIRYFIFLKT